MEQDYKSSLFFQIISTAKYFDKLFEQYFKELNMGVNASEHLILCVIQQTPNCCQRDLAKILLKDRANTGKLVNTLQQKGYINIELKTKDNRPVKILTVSAEGEKIIEKTKTHIDPLKEQFSKKIDKKIIEETKKNLQYFKNTVEKIVKTNI